MAGLKVFVRQILLYLYGMYPVRGTGEAMLPKPVMKLRVATMLFLPSSLVLVDNLGLHFSQPLCNYNRESVTAEGEVTTSFSHLRICCYRNLDLFSELHLAVHVLEWDERHSLLVPKLTETPIVKHVGIDRTVGRQTDGLDQDVLHLHISSLASLVQAGCWWGNAVAVALVDILKVRFENVRM